MIALVRVARILLLLVLVFLTLSLVIGVGAPETGIVEKGALLILIGGFVYAAVKITAITEWAQRRLARR